MKQLFILLVIMGLLSCHSTKELPTIKVLDVNRYQGTWYEIARLPNTFEKGLKCISANYSLMDDGMIKVLNKGYSEKKKKFKTAEGTAWIPDPEFPARLKVRFFWPFSGNYYIIALDDNYAYALVGDPSRKYLWILSRSKKLDDEIYNGLLETANVNGFAVESMIKVVHDCE